MKFALKPIDRRSRYFKICNCLYASRYFYSDICNCTKKRSCILLQSVFFIDKWCSCLHNCKPVPLWINCYISDSSLRVVKWSPQPMIGSHPWLPRHNTGLQTPGSGRNKQPSAASPSPPRMINSFETQSHIQHSKPFQISEIINNWRVFASLVDWLCLPTPPHQPPESQMSS